LCEKRNAKVREKPFTFARDACILTDMHTKTCDTDPRPDWHPADIVAALRKKGWSLRQLSLALGYHPNALANVLHRPWPRGEQYVAEALGVEVGDIWPSRVAERASRTERRGRPALGARSSR